MAIQTDSILDAAALPTGGSAGQHLEKVNGADYAVQWATPSGGGGGFTPTLFQAFMTTTTGQSSGLSNIANWDAADLTHADYSWVASTGILTINTAGTYSVSGHILADNTGNNRIELHVQLMVNGSALSKGGLPVLDRQYAMRNNSQDEGSAQFNNVLVALSATDTVNLQSGYAGSTNSLTMARLSVVRLA